VAAGGQLKAARSVVGQPENIAEQEDIEESGGGLVPATRDELKGLVSRVAFDLGDLVVQSFSKAVE
jgi:hypothetical protein